MPFIVLEGIDKAGKDTQTRVLGRKLIEKGYKVEHIAFPDYKTPLGKQIKKFLKGKINLRPEVRQLLYVANRWERQSAIEGWLNKKIFVIADRYIPSGIAYGIANGLDLNWMLRLEEGLPVADIKIIIDISAETSFNREVKKDIYEKDKLFLSKVRRAYLELAKRFNWVVIDGEMSIENVSQVIWETVTRYFNI